MWSHLEPLALGLLLVSACSGTPTAGGFDPQLAELVCEHHQACSAEAFELVFDSFHQCTSDYISAEYDRADCAFDPGQADLCLAALTAVRSSCEPIEEIVDGLCRTAWSCYTPCHQVADLYQRCGLFGAEVPEDPSYCLPDSAEACYSSCLLEQDCSFFLGAQDQAAMDRYTACVIACS